MPVDLTRSPGPFPDTPPASLSNLRVPPLFDADRGMYSVIDFTCHSERSTAECRTLFAESKAQPCKVSIFRFLAALGMTLTYPCQPLRWVTYDPILRVSRFPEAPLTLSLSGSRASLVSAPTPRDTLPRQCQHRFPAFLTFFSSLTCSARVPLQSSAQSMVSPPCRTNANPPCAKEQHDALTPNTHRQHSGAYRRRARVPVIPTAAGRERGALPLERAQTVDSSPAWN